MALAKKRAYKMYMCLRIELLTMPLKFSQWIDNGKKSIAG